MLVVSSLLLARETKALMLGESAHSSVREDIERIAGDDPAVRQVNGVLTVQMGPEQVVAALSAEFEDTLDTQRIEDGVSRIEARIKAKHPSVMTVFVKPQTPEIWKQQVSHSSGRSRSDA